MRGWLFCYVILEYLRLWWRSLTFLVGVRVGFVIPAKVGGWSSLRTERSGVLQSVYYYKNCHSRARRGNPECIA